MNNHITELIANCENFSEEEKDVYRTVFDATKNIPGYCISGKDNILTLFYGRYSQDDLVRICDKLNNVEDFRSETCSYHGVPYIQNIWLERRYDQNGTLLTKSAI